MSKAGSAGGGKSGEKAVARELVLKVAMHCRCQGCTPKLRSAVDKLRRQPGVVTVDQSASEAAEELRVVAAADPEGLRKLVNKAMGNKKKVDLVLTTPKPIKKASGRGSSGNKDPRLVDARPVQVRQADDSCPPSSGEGRVLATADTERLRKRVNKPTGKKKKADPVFTPKPMPINKSSGGGKEGPRLIDAPAVMELEPDPQLEAVLANMWRVPPSLDRHRQYVGHGAAAALAGNNDQHHRVGHGLAAAAGAYPCPPSSYYPSQAEASASAYPTPSPAPPGCYCPPSAPPWPFGLDYN